MNDLDSEQLSAFVDGELDKFDAKRLLDLPLATPNCTPAGPAII
jgi:hypothetical protein